MLKFLLRVILGYLGLVALGVASLAVMWLSFKLLEELGPLGDLILGDGSGDPAGYEDGRCPPWDAGC